jgi:hypothetical protein
MCSEIVGLKGSSKEPRNGGTYGSSMIGVTAESSYVKRVKRNTRHANPTDNSNSTTVKSSIGRKES